MSHQICKAEMYYSACERAQRRAAVGLSGRLAGRCSCVYWPCMVLFCVTCSCTRGQNPPRDVRPNGTGGACISTLCDVGVRPGFLLGSAPIGRDSRTAWSLLGLGGSVPSLSSRLSSLPGSHLRLPGSRPGRDARVAGYQEPLFTNSARSTVQYRQHHGQGKKWLAGLDQTWGRH